MEKVLRQRLCGPLLIYGQNTRKDRWEGSGRGWTLEVVRFSATVAVTSPEMKCPSDVSVGNGT